MKKLILALAFLATATVAFAATTTPNLVLQKPADGEYGWGTMLRSNYDVIDTSVGTQHNASGTHKAITAPSAAVSGATTTGTFDSAGDAVFGDGVTIGGVGGTELFEANTGVGRSTAIYIASVPTGATGDIGWRASAGLGPPPCSSNFSSS